MGDSRTVGRRPIYRRWYFILGALVFALLFALAAITTRLSDVLQSPYRTFYIPAESMQPTLNKNDKLLAQMRVPTPLRRGMIILFDVGDSIYIQRIAALPGDRVELIDGDVYLNGRVVPRRRVGREAEIDEAFGVRPERLVEQFPGESGTHQILDSGHSFFDDVPEQVVLPGHVFVLGDNRDHTADSRVSREEMGVGQLPIADIRGVPLFFYWRPDKGFVREPILH